MKKILFAILLLPLLATAQERAKVNIETGEVIQFQSAPVAPVKAHWLPVTRTVRPAFDSSIEKLVRTNTVTADTLTVSFNIVALTQSELDARAAWQAENDAESTRKTQLENAMAALEAGTATNRQVQTVLFRILRQMEMEKP